MEPLEPMAAAIAELLRERGETVAICETTAGGLVSAALLAVPGASVYYRGAAVTYTGVARSVFLDIDLADHPGVRLKQRALRPADRRHDPRAARRDLGHRRDGRRGAYRQPLRRRRGTHLHRGRRAGRTLRDARDGA